MNSVLRNQAGIVRELLDATGSIGIIIGQNQNFDTVAAALGLYLTLLAEGKNVQIVSKKDPIVEVSSLVGIDRVSKSFDGLTKILTISVPYREGEIEKVSYNIEGDKLNVNLFAEENGINFNEKDIEYIRKGSNPALIITLGIANEAEIAGLVDLKSVKSIHIDKNPMNSITGDAALIDPTASSLSEIVTGLILALNLLPDLDAVQNLMDGITFETRNFTSSSTSPSAFEAAGFLMQNGAKRKIQDNRPRRDSFPAESHFLQNPNPRFNQNRGQNQPQNQPRPRPNAGLDDLISKVEAARQNQPRPAQNQPQNQQVSNNPRPRQNNQNTRNPFLNNNSRPQINNQVSNQPQMPVSAPKEVSAETKDMPDEAQYTEGSTGEVPDDWFLPKVFKGTKKGN